MKGVVDSNDYKSESRNCRKLLRNIYKIYIQIYMCVLLNKSMMR